MTVSVGAGVTTTLGSPFAGILFSAELCSTVFLLSNFWKLFVCATVVKIWYEIGTYFVGIGGLHGKSISTGEITSNLPHYVLLGLICGWLCSVWIYCFSVFLQFKAKTKIKLFKNPYVYSFCALFLIGLLNFNIATGYIGNKGLVNQLWNADYLYQGQIKGLTINNVWAQLIWTYLIRCVCIMLFATCAFPNGVAFPSLTQGAIIGRLYGEVLR